jgi:hypothetical protein
MRDIPRLIVFLLALCFVVQSTAVQTHVHFAEQANASAAASTGHIEAVTSSKGNSPADCPLCQEAAMAGAYVLPDVPALPPPPTSVLWTATTAMATFAILAPPLGWLSRAPPE